MAYIGIRAFEDTVQEMLDLDADVYEIAVRPSHAKDGIVVPATNLNAFDILKKKKIISVHGGILYHGVNLMNKSRNKQNENAIELAIAAANRFDAKYIVFHPGYIERAMHDECSFANLGDLMRTYQDNRLLLELVPVFGYAERHVFPVCHVDSWRRLRDNYGKEIMLDLGHAAINSRILRNSTVDYANELIKALNIKFVHVADNDGSKDGYEDAHLSIGKGDVPLEAILKQNKTQIDFATIEVNKITPQDIKLVRCYLA